MSKILPLFLLYCMVLAASGGNIVCSFLSWAIYKPDDEKFQAADVDPNLCTHILYEYVGLSNNNTLAVLDDWELTGLHEIDHLLSLKEQNPDLKILVDMGGWNEGSLKYSTLAKDPEARATMIKSVIDFIEQYSLDGFNVNWEYPGPEDKDNFVLLLEELKNELNTRNLILSTSVSGLISIAEISYDVVGVAENVDMLNVLTTQLDNSLEGVVRHHDPLYPSHLDQTAEEKMLNVAAEIQYWLDAGASPNKINLGIITYGVPYILDDPTNTSLYAPGTRTGPDPSYHEICQQYSDWNYVWDDEQQVPHIIKDDRWIGFEDPKSIQAKVEFANLKKLGGVAIWSLDGDDFRGLCEGENYALLRTIKSYLN